MNNQVSDQESGGKKRGTFSIKSILVVTAVFAATAMSLNHLYAAAMGDKSKIGQFVIVTAMLPMIVLVGASWFFKIFGKLIK